MMTRKSGVGILIIVALMLSPLGGIAQNEPQTNGANSIQLNFRGASLDAVLDYLSQVAGFIIVKETDISGTLDVWSHQPLTQDEAINLLNTVLHEKGYSAIRNGRTLTIVTRDEAKTKHLPVETGNNPDVIPRTDMMVTQIVPVRYTDAMKLIENLQPLLPSYATMSANESSNAVVLTDTQTNVRRMVEIIRALDTSISNIATIQVFPLRFTDAAKLAEIISALFQSDDANNRGRNNTPVPPFFGGRGGRGGGGGGDNESGDSEARKAASRVVAVADETTNAVIVNAPEELMPMIAEVIGKVDTAVTDLTEIRVFTLQYADAYEMADQIVELFPDENSQSQNQQGARFGPGAFFGRGGGGGGRGGNNNNQSDQSSRQLQQTTVRSVADPRTNSVIVFAASETMLQIEQMVKLLDSDSSKKQNVYVYYLEYADVDNVAEILRNIFESNQTTNINRQTDNNANTLNNRTVNTTNAANQGGQRGNN